MQEIEQQFPEGAEGEAIWGTFPLDSLTELVQESNHVFLPPKSNPDQTTLDLIKEFQTDPNFQIFGYSINGKPISYILALSHTDPNLLSIGPMYVSKDHQGQGFGKKQVEDFIEYARVHHYKGLYTKTWSRNEHARAIFEKLGFGLVKTKNADRADGDSSVGYELSLYL